MRTKAFILSFLLLSSIFLCLFESMPVSAADNEDFWIPAHGPGVIGGTNINYSRCWTWLRSRLNYTLEYSRNGVNWYVTGGLQAVFHNTSEDTKKLTLIFNATQGNPAASYRLTCLFPGFVKDYFSLDRVRHLLIVRYTIFGHQLEVNFNYTDLLDQGLTFTWGNNTNVFWFRMQRNNLANGRYVLDPFYRIKSSGTSLSTAYAGGGKIVRTSNGTLICVYRNIATVANIYISHSFNGGSTWTVTKRLSFYAGYNAEAPAVAINSTDICHIIWGNQTAASAGKIMYVTYNDASNTTSSLSFNCSGIKKKGLVRYCSIAIDSSNNVHVAYKQCSNFTSTSFYPLYTKKTGVTWSSPLILEASADLATTNSITLVVNSTNSVYVFYDRQVSAGNIRINCVRYWSGNSTWSGVRTITSTASRYINNYPSMSFYRNGSMILVWQGNNTGSTISQVKYTKSKDGFSSWSAPKNITTGVAASSFQIAPSIAIDNGTTQTAHVVWYGDTVALSLYKPRYSNSTDFGTTWTRPINLSSTTGHNWPVLFWSWFPIVGGKHLNIPWKDYMFVWTNNSVIQLYKSSSLILYSPGDVAPQFSGEDPVNGSTVSGGSPYCSVYVFDVDNLSSMRVCLFENSTGSWVKRYSTDTHLNATHGFTYPYVGKRRWYWWKVSANDGVYNSTAIYKFYVPNILPYISNMQPTNGSVNRDIATRDMWTNVSVAEQSHEYMNVTFYSNATQMFTSHAMGVGNSTNLVAYGDTPNWHCVDDTDRIHGPGGAGYWYSNNDTDYVQNDVPAAPYKNDTYTMQDHTTESYTIYNLTLYASTWMFFDDGGGISGSGSFVINTHGRYYTYSMPIIGWGTWEEVSKDLPTNPYTGNPWTWAEVDALNVGVMLTGFDTGKCSAVYFKVNPAWDMLYGSGHYRRYGYNASVQNNTGTVYTARWDNVNFSLYAQKYYWYVTVGDGYGTNTSGIYWFQTRIPGILYILTPYNNTLFIKTSFPYNVLLNVTFTTYGGTAATICFYNYTSGFLMQTNSSCGNGTYRYRWSCGPHTYRWFITVSIPSMLNTSRMMNFSLRYPLFSYVLTPINNTVFIRVVPTYIKINLTLVTYDGYPATVRFYNHSSGALLQSNVSVGNGTYRYNWTGLNIGYHLWNTSLNFGSYVNRSNMMNFSIITVISGFPVWVLQQLNPRSETGIIGISIFSFIFFSLMFFIFRKKNKKKIMKNEKT